MENINGIVEIAKYHHEWWNGSGHPDKAIKFIISTSLYEVKYNAFNFKKVD